MRHGARLRVFALAIVLTLVAGSALADAIDGNWCHDDGRRFTIRGSDIVTPGGTAMRGDYRRHYFSYVAPAAERHAGKTLLMTLVNENTVRLRVGETADGGDETWQRCAPSTS